MKCLIVDDDPLSCEMVEAFLARLHAAEGMVRAGDGLTALQLAATHEFDLVFLDLELPGVDGETLLKALPPRTAVIVISAHTDFGARSYEYGVVDYLVKPLTFERFVAALTRARARLGAPAPAAEPAVTASRTEIFLKDGTDIVRVALAELLYVKAEANYSLFVTPRRSVMSLVSIKRLESILPEQDFPRVHRSYMVNRRLIDRIEDGTIHMGEHRIPVGDRFKPQLAQSLGVIA